MNDIGNITFDPSSGIAGAWYEGNWFEGLTGPFIASMGETAFLTVIMIWLVGVTWIFSRSMSMAFVVMALFGSVLASGLPGQGQMLGWIILVLVAAYALFKVYTRRGAY
jgi:hypothetical protein